ncbi:CDP-glycerol glycerophosphotransferase family protein [Macrococcus sp. DPC7161]|uniref:CDP-glycerol glycerophosphotransferase family protein n=1 Tax=Macrococcus sp. DPC7161 TaxID=2507060 RepID=UPI00100AE611|nr:CDP-glycerol glycerophosphotransferase family protein [Macrococcus sp. DPC7161]RXK18802.1 CDP-glycerol--glycerophosphate glycerophosphotransferase [Macrococcus sp. DPC7161]
MTFISIKQNNDKLLFSNIDEQYQIIQFEADDKIFRKEINQFQVQICLSEVLEILQSDYMKKIKIFLISNQSMTYKEALIKNVNLQNDYPDYPTKNYFQLDDIVTVSLKYRISLKRFEISISPFETVNINDYQVTPYFDKQSVFSLSLLQNIKPSTYFNYKQIDSFNIKNSKINLFGKFSLINALAEKVNLVIEHRESGLGVKWPLNIFKTEQLRSQTYNAYYFKITEEDHIEEIFQLNLNDGDTLDMYIEIYLNTLKTPIKIKIGNPRILVERFLKGKLRFDRNDGIYYLMPYFTLKGRNLSFKIAKLSHESDASYEAFSQSMMSTKELWVVGERHYKAQDNGFHFFKYMRLNHPEIDTYYIIDFDSIEYKNVKPYGNVVDYRSPKHFEIMAKATKIFTTHHPELIYPMNDREYIKEIKAQKIFLQHGVLGTKNLTQINGNQLNDFNVDMFLVSSEREKQIVQRDLKFSPQQIKVTGLSRFDELFKTCEIKNQILIIPTWRDWLTNIEQFLISDYFLNYSQLLNRDEIKTIAQSGTEVIFCLHPNMQNFLKFFDVPNYITTISQGEVDVQRLIKESKLMITDYSSVGFDFSFLYKPVIYYQFDKKQFIGKNPSHLDIERELPGYIVNNEQELINKLKSLLDDNCQISETVKHKIDRFVKYRDMNNSERIYMSALNFENHHRQINQLKYDILSQHFLKRFRKNKKVYFKAMKMLNLYLTKCHKVDEKLIFIESNVGKSVSDSPKNIYDELKKQNKDYKVVWVSNQQYPFDDENVITVKRLSFEYFYYISIAKYWINNQNFPYYIKKHPNTIYIQTWHGTPLKKMLNDVNQFEGRDAGYKDRVNIATSKWDYLISPSRYATTCFKSAFRYEKNFIEAGYPRNDWAHNMSDSEMAEFQALIKLKLGINDGRKIILYAPTFRDDLLKSRSISLPFDLNELREISNDYIILIKPHLLVGKKLIIPDDYQGFVFNVYDFPDINELYAITDICITDYSSVMFDFANTRKPLLFYTYDLEKYRDQLRGFYMDFEKEAPGPLIYDTAELISAIKNIDKIKTSYQEKYNQFFNKYCEFENGNASKYIVEQIIK